jgi:putative spermidine/putrescine transport system substrate-binding protein
LTTSRFAVARSPSAGDATTRVPCQRIKPGEEFVQRHPIQSPAASPLATHRKNSMHIRHFICIASVSLNMISPVAVATDETLTVTSWGGAYAKGQRKVYFEPFTKATGTKIREDEWDGSVAKIKGMVDAGQVSWDVVDLYPVQALQGCEEGWLEKIDYTSLGGKQAFVEGAAMECAVGTTVYGTIYAYNADKFPVGGPSTMADFWNVKKYPGPRAMQKTPKTTLEFALIADGVAAREVYAVLATKAGVTRAFRKLDEIKPFVKVWWTAGAQPPQLLADGEVVMTTGWNGRIHDAVKNHGKNFKIVWDGQGIDFDLWAIPKGAKHALAAKRFVAFATKPDVTAQQPLHMSYAPAVKAALAKVPANVMADLPNAPQNLKNAFVVSPRFWADHEQELTERFNEWLAR